MEMRAGSILPRATLGQKSKYATTAGSFATWGGEKTLVAKAPHIQEEGGEPQVNQKLQNALFYNVFLSCMQANKLPRNRLPRGQVGNLSPGSSTKSISPAFLQCLLLAKRNNLHFVYGYGALREEPGTQREIINIVLQFYVHFLQDFCIVGERVKG